LCHLKAARGMAIHGLTPGCYSTRITGLRCSIGTEVCL
jgi:hypothetical protein